MAVDAEMFKNAFHVDGTDDDALIDGYISSAENFIKNSVGDDDEKNTFYSDSKVSSLLDTAVLSLAGTYYQYRMALSDVQAVSIDLTVNSIIGQLRGLYDLMVGDTDAT
ncbi:head-tail connector protein [Liquorilactobacillus mali]|uniref:DNA packaging protein n=1 Tax=Liquorilactobacillus mali KCTC 3596 = DSM 20444 TaxID=1046596 RepID=J1F405_9LACO|nr:head-tail connector protein [Liquorilactobacillus mali]EJF00341.1 hypothetical protein LMA_03683 [Liquorilactobacillus mali KCTC 3596 = DSM 20444]KRN08825.1 hypothetical protein FD00_GL001742 [Liquorilactobacillus mali KCTC 3596 = DSM 20444]QFQ74575.1 phage gp6-like head-tail connector protein [Liquorilactobacillus mali]